MSIPDYNDISFGTNMNDFEKYVSTTILKMISNKWKNYPTITSSSIIILHNTNLSFIIKFVIGFDNDSDDYNKLQLKEIKFQMTILSKGNNNNMTYCDHPINIIPKFLIESENYLDVRKNKIFRIFFSAIPQNYQDINNISTNVTDINGKIMYKLIMTKSAIRDIIINNPMDYIKKVYMSDVSSSWSINFI